MELTRGDVSQTRNHWWWRPGWGPGARYATFHLTFELAPELSSEAVRCGRSLSNVPYVDVVPPAWLHLTMTGVGFMETLDAQTLQELSATVSAGAATLAPEPLVLDGLRLGREGLSLTARPDRWLLELKRIQEDAVTGALGVKHDEYPFLPHVSLAYFRSAVDLPLIHRAIEEVSPREVVINRPTLSLIELGRDDEVYTWRVLSQYALRG